MAWFDSWTEEMYTLIMWVTVGTVCQHSFKANLYVLQITRQKASGTKHAMLSPDKPKKRARVSTAKELPSLHTAHQIKEAGKETHLWAAKTRVAYSGHIHQACSWLQSHFPEEGMPPTLNHTGEDSEIYSDPNFKNAFEHVSNRCSDKALALYLSLRGFQENSSQSTIDSVQVGFKMLWDKTNTFGIVMVQHSVGSGITMMSITDGKATWSCESLNRKVKLTVTQHLEHLAFSAVVFMLWMGNYKLKLKCGDVKLDKTVVDGMFMKYL
ncbi:hypothetical protein F5J12DRAFT_785638 [Pisolithus orientalis]|uniref:uncharacterized protein n=1 Tax=Pisolithus orientalis TaxID=936130 RepID=UPI0022256965|nr:uncharacterized protein F5J12DRAFT_785638 [Pisolithus orientalis]KAI5995292.1 hypothetical protein F5J12DRAFT_785638 [Pisolithus orientalis]